MFKEKRDPAVAGSFYPSDPKELSDVIDEFLSLVPESTFERLLRGMVVPHAGYLFSGPVAAYGYKELKAINNEIKEIILIGPSHISSFPGAAESGHSFWSTPLGDVNIGSLKNKIDILKTLPDVHRPEHSLEVQVPFIQKVMEGDFTLFPILTGDLSPKAFANALFECIGSDTFVIISSDLSHYHTYEQALSTDGIANDAIPSLDFEKLNNAEACGMAAIRVLMHLADMKGWEGRLIDYRNSGDTAGDKSRVVGYGCYGFYR